jgi:hypothetical protein
MHRAHDSRASGGGGDLGWAAGHGPARRLVPDACRDPAQLKIVVDISRPL